jgi:hypothetical protein
LLAVSERLCSEHRQKVLLCQRQTRHEAGTQSYGSLLSRDSRATERRMRNLMRQTTPYRRRRRRKRQRQVNVLPVDRCPATRLGIKMSPVQDNHIEFVGEASDAKLTLLLDAELHPDVVNLDIERSHEGRG